MRLRSLIATAAASLALLAAPLTATAAPAPAPPVQSQAEVEAQMQKALPSFKMCNPQGRASHYCSPLKKGHWARTYLEQARADAKAHTDREWRKGVPFPDPDSVRNKLDGFGAVYVVTGTPAHKDKPTAGPFLREHKIYKFGMTQQANLMARPVQSMLACKKSPNWINCDVEIIAITQIQNGGYHARWLEAALFVKYVRLMRFCPDGARSCR